MMTTTTTGAAMTPDESSGEEVVNDLRLPDVLESPRLLVELTEAVHGALRAAEQGWLATTPFPAISTSQEGGAGLT
jgi:hypothetical protein